MWDGNKKLRVENARLINEEIILKRDINKLLCVDYSTATS